MRAYILKAGGCIALARRTEVCLFSEELFFLVLLMSAFNIIPTIFNACLNEPIIVKEAVNQ